MIYIFIIKEYLSGRQQFSLGGFVFLQLGSQLTSLREELSRRHQIEASSGLSQPLLRTKCLLDIIKSCQLTKKMENVKQIERRAFDRVL